MKTTSLRMWILTCIAGTVLLAGFAPSASAVERSLLGIRIYSNVKTVLRRFGNPNFVLTSGQVFNAQSNSITGGPQGGQMGGQPGGNFGQPGGFQGGNGMGQLPPMQPNGGPVPAFGAPQMPQNEGGNATDNTSASNGEVTLVYEKPSGATYEFLLSPSGSVIQITALGYADAAARTSRSVTFGSTYTQVINRYGYPEDQSRQNGVTIVNYSNRAHVAFELVDNSVVGIVVAAIG